MAAVLPRTIRAIRWAVKDRRSREQQARAPLRQLAAQARTPQGFYPTTPAGARSAAARNTIVDGSTALPRAPAGLATAGVAPPPLGRRWQRLGSPEPQGRARSATT